MIDVDDQTVCYCRGYTLAAIRADFQQNGRSTILEAILRHKTLGLCRCAETNPSGR